MCPGVQCLLQEEFLPGAAILTHGADLLTEGLCDIKPKIRSIGAVIVKEVIDRGPVVHLQLAVGQLQAIHNGHDVFIGLHRFFIRCSVGIIGFYRGSFFRLAYIDCDHTGHYHPYKQAHQRQNSHTGSNCQDDLGSVPLLVVFLFHLYPLFSPRSGARMEVFYHKPGKNARYVTICLHSSIFIV